ncbi:MAG: hypothetical protein L6301_11850 [Desulfobacteraceae bacterium]|nr:hypothetical protein [Pseudomonadota bacterium]MCG2752529.1 hypothetical protein [Desulfobacteraceae bacterium]
MDLLIIENWETVRYFLGGLICILSVVFLMMRPKSFNQTLAGEISNKKIRKIKKQVVKLAEENNKANRLLKSLNKATTIVNEDASTKMKTFDIVRDNSIKKIKNKSSLLQPFVRNSRSEEELDAEPYERVRFYAESGMEKENIFEKTNIPMAEIELILKFHRLNRMSKHKNGIENRMRAYA